MRLKIATSLFSLKPIIKKNNVLKIPKNLYLFTFGLAVLIMIELVIIKPDHKVSQDLVTLEGKCSKQTQYTPKLQCWDDLFDTVLKEKNGLDNAFTILGDLYSNYPQFASDCHGITHKIGAEAFHLFESHKDFEFSGKSFYCGYGFYHGFMEEMLHTTGTLNGARDFCAYVGKKLANENKDAKGTCYHGIGHGVVDGSDPRAEGNVEAIIQPGLDLCQKVAANDTLLNRCATGVFNSMAIMMSGNQHKLSINKNNPIWICQKQTNAIFQLTCFQEMNTLLLTLYNGDFEKASQWLKKIPKEEDAVSAMDSLGQHAASFRKKNSDQSNYINVCQEWPQDFRSACIGGFSAGILLYGTPGEEYREGLQFCNSNLFSEADHKACMERFMWSIYNAYSTDKFKGICQSLNENDKQYCSNLLKR